MIEGFLRRTGFVLALIFAVSPAHAGSFFGDSMKGMKPYLEGVKAVKKHDYKKGIPLLAGLVDGASNASWQDGAHYWLAFAHMAHDNPARDLQKSQRYFQDLVKLFPKSGHKWDAENYLRLIRESLETRRIKNELLKN